MFKRFRPLPTINRDFKKKYFCSFFTAKPVFFRCDKLAPYSRRNQSLRQQTAQNKQVKTGTFKVKIRKPRNILTLHSGGMSVESRFKHFKNHGRDGQTLRLRRAEVTVELRRQRKEDQLFKRRSIDVQIKEETDKDDEVLDSFLSMETILAGLYCAETDIQLQAARSIRKVLSKEKNPPIKKVIDAGIVPILVQLLSREECPSLQYEAAWALTNISSGTSQQTQCVVNAGAVPCFIDLLSSRYPSVYEQSVWALGNIAGDGPELRDYTLKLGVLKPLVSLIKSDIPVSALKNVTWTLSNLCRCKKPAPPFEIVKKALPVFAYLINHTDNNIIADACWALSYVTDGSNDKIQEVIECDVVARLVELLRCDILNILTPALRTIGNIVTGSDTQTQLVLNANVTPALKRLLAHSKLSIQKEAAWAVSNIAAGNSAQIQYLLDWDIMISIIDLLSSPDYKTIKESAWAITNFTSGAKVDQIGTLLQLDVLGPLTELLKLSDSMILLVVLDAFKNLLAISQTFGKLEEMALSIEEIGALLAIENLQHHSNPEVYQASISIIETFFSEDDCPDIEPSVDEDDSEYGFGTHSDSSKFFF